MKDQAHHLAFDGNQLLEELADSSFSALLFMLFIGIAADLLNLRSR
jgi:hypothetical protein